MPYQRDQVRSPHPHPAGALAWAPCIASGIRGMEQGTLSAQHEPDRSEIFANLELARLAMPRRVFTLSQVQYAIDRLEWLHSPHSLIGGLAFTEGPKILRCFHGRLKPVSDRQDSPVAKLPSDLGDSL